MNVTKKEQLKPLTFYYWKETFFKADRMGVKVLSDICFIIHINKTSAPYNWQCEGVEIESIDSDLYVGHNYNYHYKWGERKISKYVIKELSFDELTPEQKSRFWGYLFDEKSALCNSLSLRRQWGEL